ETKETSGYTIKGYIQGASEGMVYLETSGEDQKIIDSTKLDEGKFSFTGNVEEPLKHSIREKGKQSSTTFILDNEIVNIHGKSDSLWSAKITGAKNDSIYKSYYKKE